MMHSLRLLRRRMAAVAVRKIMYECHSEERLCMSFGISHTNWKACFDSVFSLFDEGIYLHGCDLHKMYGKQTRGFCVVSRHVDSAS